MFKWIRLLRVINTISPMIPAPTAVDFMSLKHALMLFFAMMRINIPTNCFDAI